MSYSDALVSQLYLLDYWRHNTEESEFIYEGLKGFVMSPRSLQQNMANIFSQADTYYISEEIADVLLGGFDTLPNNPLGEVRPSSPYGWAFFQQAIVCPFPTPITVKTLRTYNVGWAVQALAWGPLGQGDDEGLNLGVFVRHTGSSHLPCSGMTTWSWESGWDRHWGYTGEAGRRP